MAHYYACKFGFNRLRIDGDIRQKASVTAIMENVVIAIYRLRPIQQEQQQLAWLFGTRLLGSKIPEKRIRDQRYPQQTTNVTGENETGRIRPWLHVK